MGRSVRVPAMGEILGAMEPPELGRGLSEVLIPPVEEAEGTEEADEASERRHGTACAVLDALGGMEIPSFAPELYAAIEERLAGQMVMAAGGGAAVAASGGAEAAAEVGALQQVLAERTKELDEQYGHHLDALDGMASVEELVARERAQAVGEATAAAAKEGGDGAAERARLLERVATLEELSASRETQVRTCKGAPTPD